MIIFSQKTELESGPCIELLVKEIYKTNSCRGRIIMLEFRIPQEKTDTSVINNKFIELYHMLLCAAISRESNNINENKTLRILNHAYADLMIQESTLKPIKLNNYYCVEHTGSFSVYTLKGYTNIFYVEINSLWVFLHCKNRPVHGNISLGCHQ